MKKVQKYRASKSKQGFNKGEKVGEPRKLMDSIASELIMQSEEIAESDTSRLIVFDYYEEVKEAKPRVKKAAVKEE